MTAIIFGAYGQDGFYLSQLLQERHYKVVCLGRADISISSFKEVSVLIQEHRPEFIFHLAANSTTRHDAMFENHETIATGTLNILEAVKNHSPQTRVFISGSGLQFENKGKPIKETDLFEARDAYSVSRIQSVYAARYFRRLGIKVYVGYFFNHDSPRRSERHMAMKIAAAAKRISAGSDEQIEIGDMQVIKEWTFAGDVVKGIWLLVNQEKFFEANLSSGKGYSIEEWLNACFTLIGKDYRNYIKPVKGFSAEYKSLVSDATLIHSLGFEPGVDFESLAKMMVHG